MFYRRDSRINKNIVHRKEDEGYIECPQNIYTTLNNYKGEVLKYMSFSIASAIKVCMYLFCTLYNLNRALNIELRQVEFKKENTEQGKICLKCQKQNMQGLFVRGRTELSAQQKSCNFTTAC